MKKRLSKVILATALLFGSVATNIKASDKVDFVAIGDSITTGYGLDGYTANPPYANGSFVEQLKENYSFNTTNMAIDGITSPVLVQAMHHISQQQIATIQGADVISVTIGGNDLLSKFMLLAAQAFNIDPADPSKKPELIKAIADPANTAIIQQVLYEMKTLELPTLLPVFAKSLTAFISSIRHLNLNAQIIVQTIANPYNDLAAIQPDLVSGIEAGVQAFNKIINQGAATGSYRVADVYTVFDNPDFTELTNAANPAKFLDPHPTFAGHTLIAFTVLDAMDKKLMKVENVIEPIVDLENGAPKTVEGLKLPTLGDIETAIKKASQTDQATVAAVNEMGIKQNGEIIWDLTNCKYDPALKTAQKFTVKGTVVLPKNVSNENKLPLDVSIEVNVKAAKEEPAKPEEPKKPEEPAKPAEPTKPAEPSVPEKKPEAVVEAKKTPETSDTTSLVALSISALVACGAMLVLKYRKNSKAIK